MKKYLMTLVLAAASAVSARPAEATFILSVTDGVNTVSTSGATGSTLIISGATLFAETRVELAAELLAALGAPTKNVPN